MALSPALTAGETAALAGVSTLTRYLSPVPDVTLATARVNQASFTYPLIQLTVDGVSADWGDITAGMTVWIGSTAGAKDRGVYRVKATGTSTTLNIGETSQQDPGALPIAIRSAGFADNDYVTVKYRFDIWSVLPFINAATGAIYEDKNQVVGTNNTTPEPLVDIYVNGRRNHLATLIADGAAFALEAIATPTSWLTSSGEGYTYEWITPASGWSNVSGDTTDTLTADVDPGNYLLFCNVTGDGSGTTARVIYVHIHDNDVNPPLLISEMPRSDVRDRTGRRMTFDLYDNRLASVTDGAAVIYFEMATWANQWVDSGALTDEAVDSSEDEIDVDDGSLFAEDDILLIDAEQMQVVSIATDTLTVTRAYNGTTATSHADESVIYSYAPATDVPTATRQFVGWAQRHDKSASNGLRQATLELISPSYLLGMLNSTSQVFQVVSSPATWQQIKTNLSGAAFLVWYMLRWRCANVLKLFNYTPFSVNVAGQRLPSWVIDKGTVLQQLQQLATERGNFGCNSEGEFFFLRHPNLVNYSSRGAGVIVRDSLDASLYTSASNPREKQNRVAQVRGEAFSWNGVATLPTPGYSDAPKSPGQGTSQIKLPSQVVTDQDELEQLTGDRYAQANNPYPSVNVKIQRNRDVYEPAELPFILVNIPANLSATGVEWEANIVPLTVTKVHNADGTADMDLTGEGETHGLPGDFVPVPVPNDSIFTPPYIPDPIEEIPLPSLGEFNSVSVPEAVPSPQGPTVSTGKGALMVSADGSKVMRTFDITIEPPTVEDITPTGFNSDTFVMVVHDKSTNFHRGAYVLGNDGTDTTLLYTTDAYADSVEWVEGEVIPDVYTQIESGGQPSQAGVVNAYTADTTTSITTYDFLVDNGSFSALAAGTWSFGVGWIDGQFTSSGVFYDGLQIHKTFTSTDIARIRMKADITAGGGSLGSQMVIVRLLMGVVVDLIDVQNVYGAGLTLELSGTVTCDEIQVFAYDSRDVTGYVAGIAHITELIVEEVTAGGDAVVAFSNDYGVTVNTLVAGTSPGGDGAFCMSRYGPVSLAATDGALKKATRFGGSYGALTGGTTTGTFPIAARLPWFRIGNGSKTNNGTSPDYYIASAAAIAGDTLWKVVSGVKTAVTPDVGGTEAIAPTSNSIGTYGPKRICFIGDVTGTRYIFASKDAGATWVDTQIDNLVSIRAQRFSPSGLIWIAGAGADGAYYSDDGGLTWDLRTIADGCLYIELFG